MTLEVRIDTDALDRELDALFERVEGAVLAGLSAAARRTAQTAQRGHAYANRTQNLELSTEAFEAEGDVWSGNAAASVMLQAEYASYVNKWARKKTGLGILDAAWRVSEPGAEAEFESLIAEACRG